MTENRFEELIPLYDLQQRSLEEQAKYVEEYRKNFTNKEITDFWGKKENFMYNYMKKIGLKATYKTRKSPRTVKPKVAVVEVKEVVEEDKKFTEAYEFVKEYINTPLPQAPQATQEPEGFGFNINGTYSSEKLIKRLEKLSLILDDEETEFEVRLSIKEKVGTV